MLFFKRFFDIVTSVAALPFVSLVVTIIAPFIYFTDCSTVFYNTTRRGLNGKVFKIYNLRSMYVNSPLFRNADGSTLTSDNDLRVTKIGKFMRETSLDEFPQFLNVLKGKRGIIETTKKNADFFKGCHG